MRQRYLDVSEQWTEDTHSSKYSTLRFEYRVTCEPHYYGKGCENLCRPRDDSFGHYSCSPSGERVCLSGWTGDYCTKRKYNRNIINHPLPFSPFSSTLRIKPLLLNQIVVWVTKTIFP